MYIHTDAELATGHKRALELTYAYNHTKPEEEDKRQDILQTLIDAKGKVFIEQNFRCDYGFNIHVGNNFYANYDCTILDVCEPTQVRRELYKLSVKVAFCFIEFGSMDQTLYEVVFLFA